MPKSKKSKRSTYRPPEPAKPKPSSKWVPYVGVGLVLAGTLLVIVTYVTGLPNWSILAGFAAMGAGLITLSQWR